MSGEIIKMSDPMTLIFEVMDLTQASPATVSRCGMIYLEPSQLGWEPIMKSWITELPEEINNEATVALFNWLVPPCVDFVVRNCKVRFKSNTRAAALQLSKKNCPIFDITKQHR